MLRRLMSRLTGGPVPPRGTRAPSFPSAPPPPAEETGASALSPPSASPPSASLPGTAAAGVNGPVFSSRAVRDAALVTGAIEALKRFADGQIGVDEILLKLTGLTPDQVNFLQISVESALLARAAARAHESRGPKALELQRMMDDLGDLTPATARPAPASVVSGPRIGTPGPRMPPAAAKPTPAFSTPLHAAVPESADVPAPPPAAKPSALPLAIPRMPKADADQRRARLMESLTDHLSTTEAAR